MEEGRNILRQMIPKADVLIENYRPGVMGKWDLDYAAARRLNPGIIYASVSGYGHTGPYIKKASYDIVAQAMSGIMSITGAEGGHPTRVGTSIGDIVPGMFCLIGILMALHHRSKTGEGQHIDIAMMDSLFAILENAVMRYQASGEVPGPIGNRHPHVTPFDSFRTKDGHIVIGAGNHSLFKKLCHLLDRSELIADARFADYHSRHSHHKELKEILDQCFSRWSMADALSALESAGIPCAPINTIDNLMENPQIHARKMLVEVEHPVAGKMKLPGTPIKMSETPGNVGTPAPMLGEHTDYVLRKFTGLTDDEIRLLRHKGVVR